MKQKTAISVGRPREFDREAALRTAMKLFSKHGYEGVSISDLTRVIGIAPTSLYAAFGNKEMLYREALTLTFKRCNPRFTEQDVPVRNWINALLRQAVPDATDPDYPSDIVTLGMLNCRAENSVLAAMVAQARAKKREKIAAGLSRAVLRGELPSGTDTQALARYLLALVQGIAIQAHDGATPETLLSVVEVALRSWSSLEKGATAECKSNLA